jgi:hypothetical protein
MVSNELQDKLEEAILILVNNYGFEPFDVKPFYMFYYDTYIAIDYQEGFAKQVSYSDLFSPES